MRKLRGLYTYVHLVGVCRPVVARGGQSGAVTEYSTCFSQMLVKKTARSVFSTKGMNDLFMARGFSFLFGDNGSCPPVHVIGRQVWSGMRYHDLKLPGRELRLVYSIFNAVPCHAYLEKMPDFAARNGAISFPRQSICITYGYFK